MTKTEFLKQYNITSEELTKQLNYAQTNEYNTEDLTFNLNEDNYIRVEFDRNNDKIINVYEY